MGDFRENVSIGRRTTPPLPDRLVALMHRYVESCSVSSTINLPVSLAARKGVSALAKLSGDNRVALTSHGRVVAVVDSPDRVDAEVREVREAAWAVMEAAAELAAQRSRRYSLDELCAKVGVDAGRVRERAARMRAESDAR